MYIGYIVRIADSAYILYSVHIVYNVYIVYNVDILAGSPVRRFTVRRFASSTLTSSSKSAGSNLYCEPVPPVRRFDLLCYMAKASRAAFCCVLAQWLNCHERWQHVIWLTGRALFHRRARADRPAIHIYTF